MPPVFSKLKNHKVHSQTKEVILNVLTFMTEEAENGTFILPLAKCQERTARATGTSLRTVTRVNQEHRSIEAGATSSFHSPDKKRNRKSTVTGLDDFDLAAVRRTVHNFYIQEKRSPTINGLRSKLVETMDFRGGNTSVRKILKKLGFKWQKTKSNRQILVERSDIVQKRIDYLNKIKKYREENRPIVYVDETYILSGHVQKKSWSDDSCQGMLSQVSKGDRLIIVHAGGAMGFIPDALLMWKSSKTTGDYHHNMNKVNYKKWIQEKLIPNLPPNSVVISDNAPYHNVVVEKAPTSGSTKQEMKEWLTKKNISFSENMLKPTLYDIVKRNKPTQKLYEIDELLKSNGHTPLRLPPYHPDLNPIENVWGIVKGWVAARNVTCKVTDVERLCREKFGSMGKEEWMPFCERAEKFEEKFRETDILVDEEIDRIIIEVGCSDSESSDSSSESDTDL